MTFAVVFSLGQSMLLPREAGTLKQPLNQAQQAQQTSTSRIDIEGIIQEKSLQHGVWTPNLIKAVVQAESAFNPNAVSSAGAQGLMQLMPKTAASLGVNNSFNPNQNVDGGVRYFKRAYWSI